MYTTTTDNGPTANNWGSRRTWYIFFFFFFLLLTIKQPTPTNTTTLTSLLRLRPSPQPPTAHEQAATSVKGARTMMNRRLGQFFFTHFSVYITNQYCFFCL